MTDEGERPAEPMPVPALVAWIGRHSGKAIFAVFFGVAMLEGVAMCAAQVRGAP
jgi:hypothetical protein